MKVKVIGFWGGYPAAGSATSSYIVEKDGFVLAIDMGSGALAKIQKYYHVQDLDAVILSHYHHDHVADVGVLQYARLVQTYLTNDRTVLPIYGHKEDEESFMALTHDQTEGIAYDPNKPLQIGPFSITFMKTEHPVPCYGMRIFDGESTFVYTADTAFHKRWIDFTEGADMIITDCNFYAHQDGSAAGHMTSKEGATIAKESGVRDLLLSHLPQYGNLKQLVEEARQIFSGNILLAHEGMVWDSKK